MGSPAASGRPHLPQKLWSGWASALHDEQASASTTPHFAQKR